MRVPSGTKLIFHRNDPFSAKHTDSVRESAGKLRETFGKRSGNVRDKVQELNIRLSDKELMIVESIEKNGSITTQEAMVLLNINERPAQKLLKKLINEEIITRVGAGRNTYYVLCP